MKRYRCKICQSTLDLEDEVAERKAAVRCLGVDTAALDSGTEMVHRLHWPTAMEEVPYVAPPEEWTPKPKPKVGEVVKMKTTVNVTNMEWDGEDWRQDVG